MPRITGKTSQGKKTEVYIKPLKTSKKFSRRLNRCSEADTDEKWLEIYLCDENGKCIASQGKLLTTKIYIDFQLRDKITNKVLFTVKQGKKK